MLAYHGVEDESRFAAQLNHLQRAFPSRASALVGARRSYLLSFDDGHRSVVERAMPLLVERGLRAIMFVCPGLVTEQAPYWWDVIRVAEDRGLERSLRRDVPPGMSLRTFLKGVPDSERRLVVAAAFELLEGQVPVRSVDMALLREWVDAGFEVGNHTWDHPCLDMCTPDEQAHQIGAAHHWLAEFLGAPPTAFAYPNGDWTREAEAVLEQLGYTSGYLFDHRVSRVSDHPLRRSRLRLDADASLARAKAIVSGAHPLLFAASRRHAPGRANPTAVMVEPEWNRTICSSEEVITSYDPRGGLSAAERALVDRWVPLGARVLDLGVGTGRTYPELDARAGRYVGIDYSAEMVAAARAVFPGADFRVADAADLSDFASRSFDAVMFSYNGLDYLHPVERRIACLAEMRRVLVPGGVVLMSTHNPRAVLRCPRPGPDGASALKNTAVALYSTARAMRALLPTQAFWSGRGYAMDRIRPLLTYFATPAELRRELVVAGFEVVELLPGDHPAPMRRLATPWTYLAAKKPAEPASTVEVLRTDSDIEAMVTEWQALAESVGASWFQTPTWMRAWSSVLATDAELTVLAARSAGGELLGVLPLAAMSRRVHRYLPLPLDYVGIAGSGRGGADHLGPVCRDDGVAAVLLRHAVEVAGKRPLLLESVAPRWQSVASAATGGIVVRRVSCPALNREYGESFEAAWSAKVRKNVRRRERMMSSAGIVQRWVAPGPAFDEALERLRLVHERRWSGDGHSGLFDSGRVELVRRLAVAVEPPDGPWILLLEKGYETVGGLLGFRFSDSFSVYKTGWNPAYAAYGVGVALGALAMKWSEEQGLLEFDYLRGDRDHKTTLGCAARYDATILVARGLRGMALRVRESLSDGGARLGPWRPAVGAGPGRETGSHPAT